MKENNDSISLPTDSSEGLYSLSPLSRMGDAKCWGLAENFLKIFHI